jgi:hypothetical protein
MSYNSVYASLAQLSVVGQMNAELKKHESGVLDVFTSAFYTHEAAAFGVIRSQHQAQVAGSTGQQNETFQPPRSFDILHDVVVVIDVPGLIRVTEEVEGTQVEVSFDTADDAKIDEEKHMGYKENVAQFFIDQVSLEIGGSVLDTIHSDFLFINEELNGTPGKRLEYAGLGEVADARVRSRLYAPLCFWFQGGSLSRALKTVSMQLHRIDFKVQTKSFDSLLREPSAAGLSKLYICPGQEVTDSPSSSSNARLQGKIAGTRTWHTTDNVATKLASAGHCAYTLDFHGAFLNSKLRAEMLNLQETSLFITTRRQTLGASTSETQQPLDFKNAVYEIILAVKGGEGTWGMSHTADPLKSLSFSISSTPRTLTQLEPQYYRKVTQLLGPNTTSADSDNNGIYYYNLSLKNELNGTQMVSSYINASKVDDVRVRYSTVGNTPVHVYARAFNLITIKNGMVGKLFQ